MLQPGPSPRAEVGGTLTLAHLKTSFTTAPETCHWVMMDESGFSRLDDKGRERRGAVD